MSLRRARRCVVDARRGWRSKHLATKRLGQRANGRHGLMRGLSAESTTRLFAFGRQLPNRPAEADDNRHDLAVGSPRHVMEVLRVIDGDTLGGARGEI